MTAGPRSSRHWARGGEAAGRACHRRRLHLPDHRRHDERPFHGSLSAEHRAAAGVAAGDDVEVEVALDIEPRDVVVPGDLADALAGDDAASRFFDAPSHSHRKAWVRWIEEAKRAETRAARISRAVISLSAGPKVH